MRLRRPGAGIEVDPSYDGLPWRGGRIARSETTDNEVHRCRTHTGTWSTEKDELPSPEIWPSGWRSSTPASPPAGFCTVWTLHEARRRSRLGEPSSRLHPLRREPRVKRRCRSRAVGEWFRRGNRSGGERMPPAPVTPIGPGILRCSARRHSQTEKIETRSGRSRVFDPGAIG